MVNPEEAASAAPSSSTAPPAQAQPAQQNITVTNRQLNITPFAIDRDPTNTANRWDKWKRDIERQFRFFGIHDPELKKRWSNHLRRTRYRRSRRLSTRCRKHRPNRGRIHEIHPKAGQAFPPKEK